MEQIAVLRAEWLAQLSDAIESAQRLAWQLGTRDGVSDEARELYGRLEAAKAELDALRGLAGRPTTALDPEWLCKLGWSGELPDLER